MSFKKNTGIGNIVMAIMLKIILKIMKKNKLPIAPPPFIVIPKSLMPNKASESDLLLDRRKLVYRCGLCKQRFSLKSDVDISQKTLTEWLDEVKRHECYDNKKNTNH